MYQYGLLIVLVLAGCTGAEENILGSPHLLVLGIAQDAGYPQANCQKDCCANAWTGAAARQRVSCIALVDPQANQAWMFDATPDFKEQWYELGSRYPGIELAGIFLTHAHMGHYTGLMHLGREAVGAQKMPVYVMPRMKSYLERNGPWSQLVQLENIELKDLVADSTISIGHGYEVTPALVPHRDEFSETVAYRIKNENKRALFIPDIDKWEKWERSILTEIRQVDYALLDGSFYANGEIPGRDMSLIPHPFVEESMTLFEPLAPEQRAKVHFIHFNHTNPLLQPKSTARAALKQAGYQMATEGMQLPL